MVILYHKISFGSTEQRTKLGSAAHPSMQAETGRAGDGPQAGREPAAGGEPWLRGGPPAGTQPRSVLRARASRDRLLTWMDRAGLPALVLTAPGPVAWLTGGLPPPVDRSAGT